MQPNPMLPASELNSQPGETKTRIDPPQSGKRGGFITPNNNNTTFFLANQKYRNKLSRDLCPFIYKCLIRVSLESIVFNSIIIASSIVKHYTRDKHDFITLVNEDEY